MWQSYLDLFWTIFWARKVGNVKLSNNEHSKEENCDSLKHNKKSKCDFELLDPISQDLLAIGLPLVVIIKIMAIL